MAYPGRQGQHYQYQQGGAPPPQMPGVPQGFAPPGYGPPQGYGPPPGQGYGPPPGQGGYGQQAYGAPPSGQYRANGPPLQYGHPSGGPVGPPEYQGGPVNYQRPTGPQMMGSEWGDFSHLLCLFFPLLRRLFADMGAITRPALRILVDDGQAKGAAHRHQLPRVCVRRGAEVRLYADDGHAATEPGPSCEGASTTCRTCASSCCVSPLVRSLDPPRLDKR